jgi:hypothetical protein
MISAYRPGEAVVNLTPFHDELQERYKRTASVLLSILAYVRDCVQKMGTDGRYSFLNGFMRFLAALVVLGLLLGLGEGARYTTLPSKSLPWSSSLNGCMYYLQNSLLCISWRF